MVLGKIEEVEIFDKAECCLHLDESCSKAECCLHLDESCSKAESWSSFVG